MNANTKPSAKAQEMLQQAASSIQMASALNDEFPDKSKMPASVAHKIDNLLSKADQLTTAAELSIAAAEMSAKSREPQYRGINPMGNGSFGPGGYSLDDSYNGRLTSKSVWTPYNEIPKGVSVSDYVAMNGGSQPDQERAFGALGVVAKSFAGYADEFEIKHYLGGMEYKDMLTTGASAILPVAISGQVIDLLRPRSVVMSLGARLVPMSTGSLVVPRITADPAAAWKNEGATDTPADGGIDGVTLSPKRLSVIVKFSQELNEDSDPALTGSILANSLAKSFAAEIDRVALVGSGTAPEPKGVAGWVPAGNTLTSVGAASWDTLASMAGKLTGSNAGMPNGYVMAPRTEAAIAVLKASTSGDYLNAPDWIANVPRLSTASVPINMSPGTATEIFAGNWGELLIGMRIAFQLQMINELYIADGKLGLRARLRADVQVAHPASFALATGVTN